MTSRVHFVRRLFGCRFIKRNEFLSHFDVPSPVINPNSSPSGKSDDQPFDDEHKCFLAQRWESCQLRWLFRRMPTNRIAPWSYGSDRTRGSSWVLVCPTRLKQGVLDPEVQSSGTSRILEKEKSRRSSVLYPPEDHSPSARGMRWLQSCKWCSYSEKWHFQALIAGNKKASAATMVTTMRLATRKDEIRERVNLSALPP